MAGIAPVWAFPFIGGCVSKPPLPAAVASFNSPYNFRGIQNGPKYVRKYDPLTEPPPPLHPRWYCCWIEASTHALLIDPYLRWFLEDYNLRFQMSGTKWIRQNEFDKIQDALLHRRYKNGVQSMSYLAARLRNDLPVSVFASDQQQKEAQDLFSKSMDPFLVEFRKHFHDSENDKTNEGEISNLLVSMLPGMRLFIACNWSGNEFQRQLIGYGCKPLTVGVERCAGAVKGKCPFFGKDIEYFNDRGRLLVAPDDSVMPAGFTLLDMTDENARRDIYLHPGKYRLTDVLSDLPEWNGRWSVASAMPCEGCKTEMRIVQQKLVTLPFMLCIHTPRGNQADFQHNGGSSNKPYELLYNPEKLVVGPTRDSHYAIYKLVCRLEYEAHHFVADVRVQDGSFTRYSFDVQRPNQSIPENDTKCQYLVWRRVDSTR